MLMSGCEKNEMVSEHQNGKSGPMQVHATTLENTWYSCYSGPICIGYENRVITELHYEDEKAGVSTKKLRLGASSHLEVSRFEEVTSADIQHLENLAADGKLLDFHTSVKMGGVPMEYAGFIKEPGDAPPFLEMEIQTFEKKERITLPVPELSAEMKTEKIVSPQGAHGVEFLLRKNGIQPGEKWCFVRLEPTILRFMKVRLECLPVELVSFPDGRQFPLYPVKVVSEVIPPAGETQSPAAEPEIRQEETFWVDGKGVIWKRYTPIMQMMYWRCGREEAIRNSAEKKVLAGADGAVSEVSPDGGMPGPDFGVEMSVPIRNFSESAAENTRTRAETVYRIYASAENVTDFTEVFPDSDFQKKKIFTENGKTFAEITVFRSTESPRDGFRAAAPTEKDVSASNLIQWDAPKIVEIAESVAPGETDAGKIAAELEKFVYRFITNKNYSRGFVTAAEVAEIPARMAQGLILVPAEEKFVWHVWNECYIDGRWRPYDATVGGGCVGGDHIRINAGDFDYSSLAVTLFPVAKLAGKLEIEMR